jgi:hypothetical protein
MEMTRIEIKHHWNGSVLFAHEAEGNTLAITLYMAIKASTYLSGAYLSNADLSDAYLSGANLRGADLSDAYLSGADLRGADLRGADLRGANLRGANLRGADLRYAYLSGANLSGANLRGADLSDAYLSGANLRGADLSDAYLSGADLTPVRDDLWAVLSSAPREVPALIAALKAGRVDGSTYEGECSCLVGTIATARNSAIGDLGSLKPNSSRPVERFFLSINRGDTPETNQFSKMALEWSEEWLATMQAAFKS